MVTQGVTVRLYLFGCCAVVLFYLNNVDVMSTCGYTRIHGSQIAESERVSNEY